MTTKEFLQQYRDAEEAINGRLEEISRLRAMAMNVTQTLSKAPAHGHESDKIATIVSKIVDMEREVDGGIDRLQDMKKAVCAAIMAVPDTGQRTVLRMRYVNCLRWEEIAVRLNYTYRHVTRLHGQALKTVEDVLRCP